MMDTRNLIMAIVCAGLAYVLYTLVIWPMIKPAPPSPVDVTAPRFDQAPSSASSPTTAPAGSAASAPARQSLQLTSGASRDWLQLGGGAADVLDVKLSPVGAGIAEIRLVERDRRGEYLYRKSAGSREPAGLIHPVSTPTREHYAFSAYRLFIKEYAADWTLDDVVWHAQSAGPTEVVFATQLVAQEDGQPLVALTKRYQLVPGKPLINLTVELQNVSQIPLTISVQENGPTGIHREHAQMDMRFLMTASRRDELRGSSAYKWDALQKATLEGRFPELYASGRDGSLLWAAVGNKFFGVFQRPLPLANNQGGFVDSVYGLVLAPQAQASLNDWTQRSDLSVRFTTRPMTLAPGAAPLAMPFEIYAGPKDVDILKRVNPAFADISQLGYNYFHGADLRCCLVPLWLTEFMTWVLQGIMRLVYNGGAAIIVLVIIVRTLLHPLSVFQQKTMFRMQENMVRLTPKLNEVREKYANDRVKLNQEMMRVYADEGVNPAAPLVGMLPLMLQMPILGALWTALNTDIHLRHAPLDGWWIRDLSAPDALVQFAQPWDLPVLSWLPLIGWLFTGVRSINLLPVLMGVSMWLQQKYMPKPHIEAKRNAAAESTKAKPIAGPGGLTPEEQLRQQQMMANMMSIMLPFMLYYMPAGLNLYWMATNVFGIGESLLIRRQLAREKEERARRGPVQAAPKQPGVLGRMFKHLARQAEELQRKADELAAQERAKKAAKAESGGKKRS